MQKIASSLKTNLLYFFLHFAISVWPFLNFYGSETNQKLISIPNFSSLFLLYWVLALVGCEIVRVLLKIPRERVLVLYTVFVVWFFNYGVFYNNLSGTFSEYYSAFYHALLTKMSKYLNVTSYPLILFFSSAS